MKKTLCMLMAVIVLMSSLTVGVSAASKVTMYASDGRTATVNKASVSAWEATGWFTYPVTVVTKDGLAYVIRQDEYDKYRNRGYSDPVYNKKNILITLVEGTVYYEGLSCYKARVKLIVYNNTKESVYIEPRDVTVKGNAASAYFDISKIPAKSSQMITMKLDNLNASKIFFDVGFDLKIRTSSNSVNQRAGVYQITW